MVNDTSRSSSSFGISESQHQYQPKLQSHTTGETKLSKIFMRVAFGSCIFTIFTTLVGASRIRTIARKEMKPQRPSYMF